MTAHDCWRLICRAARAHISPAVFRACFAGTTGVDLHDGLLVVAVPNATVYDQMRRRFATLLPALAERVLRYPVVLRFIISAAIAGASPSVLVPAIATRSRQRYTAIAPEPVLAPPVAPFTPPDLNPRYTFDTLVVGESNRFAFAAAQSVAADPGAQYNPLFLYGGVGLGKTHLLMAIGHVAAEQRLNVRYVASDTFTNEIVDAIQRNAQDELRSRYRQVDVLLVDDIQFIGGKERTEEEFFHTFNALHNGGKQIVVTSDRPPRSIPTLHDRLRSRFEWGLLADVTQPEYDHRLAILQQKAEALDVKIPAAVLEYMARPEGLSVRALEGALNRVAAGARFHQGPLTLAMVATTLRECFGEMGRAEIDPPIVLDLVANHFSLTMHDLLGKGRSRNLAWPRQVAMFLLREETPASLAQIGAALGGRDHTTIMHGCEQVAEAMRHDEHIQREIETLRTALRSL